MLATKLFQVLFQQCSHGDDAVCHALYFSKPLLVQGRIVENLGRDAGSVDWRVGVERSDEDFDLGVDTLLLLGRLTDDRERTHTFAI